MSRGNIAFLECCKEFGKIFISSILMSKSYLIYDITINKNTPVIFLRSVFRLIMAKRKITKVKQALFTKSLFCFFDLFTK